MSTSCTAYKPVHDMLTGSFTAGAGTPDGGGIANAINFGLKANLE